MLLAILILLLALITPAAAQPVDPGTVAIINALQNAQAKLVNPSGQYLGSVELGQMNLPQINQAYVPFSPFPAPYPNGLGRNGIFPDLIGRPTAEITDGQLTLNLVPANRPAAAAQTAVPVSLTPTPSLVCPFNAPVNQTATARVIQNPGGKLIHVCAVILVSATAQSIGIDEGTGTTCGTGTVYWDGGSGGTVALAVNGGYSVPGNFVNYPMQVTGDDVCVLQSSTGNVSGHMTYGVYSR